MEPLEHEKYYAMFKSYGTVFLYPGEYVKKIGSTTNQKELKAFQPVISFSQLCFFKHDEEPYTMIIKNQDTYLAIAIAEIGEVVRVKKTIALPAYLRADNQLYQAAVLLDDKLAYIVDHEYFMKLALEVSQNETG